MLRFHLNSDDLLRTRITTTYGPLAEAVQGMIIVSHSPSALFNSWRRRVMATRPVWAYPLGELIGRYAPVDLFTLLGPISDLADALQALEGVPAEALRTEISGIYEAQAVIDGTAVSAPSWVRRLPDDRDSRRDAAAFFRRCHAASIAPYWDSILAALRKDIAMRTHVLAEQGVGALLSGLHPKINWSYPVLEMPATGLSRDVVLGGRGLELVPSVLAVKPAVYVSLLDDAAPMVLMYPLVRDVGDAIRMLSTGDDQRVGGPEALAELLGRTRAAVLIAAEAEQTTTALARLVGVSVASASQHAAVLRNAGLLRSRRDGAAVLHQMTQLGSILLHGHPRTSTLD